LEVSPMEIIEQFNSQKTNQQGGRDEQRRQVILGIEWEANG